MNTTLTVRPDFLPIVQEFFVTDADRSDKNFEIVYTATEVTGEKKMLCVCFRKSNPARVGVKNPQGIPETVAHLARYDLGAMCAGTLTLPFTES